MLKRFIDYMMYRFKKFDLFDIAVFKFVLVMFGAMFGICAQKKLKSFLPLIAIMTVIGYIWLVARIFTDFKLTDKTSDYVCHGDCDNHIHLN